MILEQNFSEADLAEVEQVFSVTMKRNYFKRIRENRCNKILKKVQNVCVFILFGCCVMLIVLEGRISAKTIFFMAMGAIGLLGEWIWKRLDGRMNPAIIVKQKYGETFPVSIEEDELIYKQKKISYTDIRCVVDYKNLMFVMAERKFLVIKADAEEKEAILSKMKENKAIRCVRKNLLI